MKAYLDSSDALFLFIASLSMSIGLGWALPTSRPIGLWLFGEVSDPFAVVAMLTVITYLVSYLAFSILFKIALAVNGDER